MLNELHHSHMTSLQQRLVVSFNHLLSTVIYLSFTRTITELRNIAKQLYKHQLEQHQSYLDA